MRERLATAIRVFAKRVTQVPPKERGPAGPRVDHMPE